MEILRGVAAAVAFSLFTFTLPAATYWIGPAGSDDNPGTEESPFAGFAAALAKDDVTEIRLLEGDYTAITMSTGTRDKNFTSADVIAEVTKPVKIVGAGREKTILRCHKANYDSYCGIYLNNSAASLSGVTIRSGGNLMPNGGQNFQAWGIELLAGVVSNCAVICNTVLNQMPAMVVKGANAFAYDCVVSNNHAYAGNMKNPAVYVESGLLQDSLITDNWGAEKSLGHGLHLKSGTVRNCTISRHDGVCWETYAGGVYMEGGTLADSVIAYNHHTGHTQSGSSAGGCYATSGVITNCLFVGNRDEAFQAAASAGGLHLNGANVKAYDCTFAENTSFTGGAQFRIKAGTASNMLIEKLNGVPAIDIAGGTTSGVYAVTAPGFKDRTEFKLPYSSPYRTAGWSQPVASAGTEVALFAGKYCYRAGENVVLTAKVTNASATAYSWKVTQGESVTTPAGTDVLTLTAPVCGDYTVEVEALSGATSLGKASTPILVRPVKCYVKPSGGDGTWPYDSSDNAPCSVQKAIDAVYADEDTFGEVELAAGTYDNLEPMQKLTNQKSSRHLIITKRIKLHGGTDDPEDTWFKATSSLLMGGAVLAHPEAEISGIKFTFECTTYDSNWWQMSHALQIGAGLASNVVVTGCKQKYHVGGPVFLENKGVMTHSVVRNNDYTGSYGRYTCGVMVRGGKLLLSSVLNNSIPVGTGDQVKGNGMYVTGSSSLVSNCVIQGNTGGGTQAKSAGGIWMNGGTVERCIIQNNANAVASQGTTAGVVDTLAWEGFREGIDDIRYGTLLMKLASEAEKRGDWDARSLAGKAKQYLVRFDKAKDSVSAARAEMIGYIERLRAVLAEKPVFGNGVKAIDGFETELADAERRKDYRRMRQIYLEYDRAAEGEKRFRAEGRWGDALALWRERWFRSGLYTETASAEIDRVIREGASEGRLADEEYLRFYGENPARDRELESAFWGKTWSSTNNALWRIGKVIGDGASLQHGRPRTGAALAIRYVETLNRLHRCLDNLNRIEFAIHQLPQVGLPDECVRLCDLVLASSNKFSAVKLCGIRMMAESLRARKTLDTAAKGRGFIAGLDAKYGAGLKPGEREEMICWVGSAFNALGMEEAMRGMEDYRRALYRSYDKRRLKIGDGVARQTLDRRYKGSLEFLETDVTTGNRGKVGKDGAEKLADPAMAISVGVSGLTFAFTVPDPKAREIEVGSADPGAFEMYLAPGEDQPYVCFLMTPGKNKVGAFNTTYDTYRSRAFDPDDVDSYRFTTEFADGSFTCKLELSWELYAGILPKTGDVWDFEVVRWGRGGNACWNGLESIHGRSTWGELEFAVDPALMRSIRLKQAHLAFNAYKREKEYGRCNGCIGRWRDEATGDPAFYDAALKPLVEELDGYGGKLGFSMSDETLDEIVREALPKWHGIRRLVDLRREEYLR